MSLSAHCSLAHEATPEFPSQRPALSAAVSGTHSVPASVLKSVGGCSFSVRNIFVVALKRKKDYMEMYLTVVRCI